VRHKHLIIVVLELHLESEGVVKASSFFLERILEVTNILAVSIPTNTLAIVALCHLLRVEERLHTLVI